VSNLGVEARLLILNVAFMTHRNDLHTNFGWQVRDVVLSLIAKNILNLQTENMIEA